MKKTEFLDRITDGRMSRRQFNSVLAAAGLSMVALPMATRTARGDEQLSYFTWAGYDNPGFFPAYVEKHGEPPQMPLFADEEEALTKLRAGFAVDLVHPCSNMVARYRDAGVIQPIDTSRLSNWPDVFDSLRDMEGTVADGKHWFIPVDWSSASVIYRTDLVDIEEESWTLLWDERYKGQLSISGDVIDAATIAALVAGVPKADLYDMSDAQVGKVAELLREQRPLLRFYWSDISAMEQALASGEIVASSAWDSSAVALKNQGVPVAYMKPKEGRLAYCCGLVLTPKADQLDLAYDLMDAMIAPEAGEWLITEMGYGHSNRKSFELVPEKVLAERDFSTDPSKQLAEAAFSQENKRLTDLQRMFEEVKAGF